MGVYENIINSKKKKEEESLYNRITGEKTSAKENYEEQKNVLTKAQKEYSKALNEEYKNTGAFDFTLPSRLEQNEFSNKILPNSKTFQSTHSPFDTKQTLEKIKTAQNNVKDLKTTVDEEYNKLKYSRYLKDAEKVASEKTNLWDKTGGAITRALTDVVSSIGMDKYTYIDEDGNKIYLPTYNDLKQQKVSQDYDTKIGKYLGDFAYTTSKILGTSAINTLAPGVGTFTYYQDMYMDNYKNTVNQGYDDIRSGAYALTSTGLEFITGKFLGSATKKLTGGTSNAYSNALSNAAMRLTNNPTVSKILGEAGSEATEEFLQEYLDNINRLVTLENSTNIDDYVSIFTDSKILEDALYSAAVGALSGGFIAGTDVKGNKNTNQNIQMFKEFKTQLEEAKKFTTDVSKIEQYDNAINKIDEYLKKPFTNSEISLPKIDTNQEVNAQQNINNINTMNKTTEGLDLIESSKVYNIDSTSETIRSIDNLLNKKNINGRFDSTLFNNTKTNAFWTVDSNGNRNVIFNPNANTNDLLQNVAIHELTHDLLSSKNSAEILNSNDIIDYVSKIDGYQEARQSLAKSYSEVYDINDPQFENMINEEVVASVLGNKLGNQEFVNRLTTENISLSKKIYNWIVDRINQLKNLVGYKSEKAYWNDVKNRFEKAYKMSYNNINKQADIRMSIYSGNAKYKNKTLNSIVFAKAVSIGETNFSVRDANNYYIIDNAIDGNYDIFKVYPIEGNEEFLNNLDKLRGEYNANRNRTSNSKNTARIEDRLGFNSGNNANVEGEQSWTEFIDSVLETVRQEKSDNKRFSIESGRNNRELDNSSFSFDNQGRTLTKEQQEYFKDSKVRDENGNLLTMYHGTSSGGHTVFDPYGGKPGLFGQGSYFTDNNSVAESYTQKGRGNNKQIYEVYLNIINPIDMDVQANVEEWKQNFSKFLPDADFPKSGTNEALYRSALEEFENSEYDRFEVAEIMIETFQKMGYDGITHIGGGRFNQKDGTRHRVFITFESNQIKNIDNTNPTSNDDIRYSQKNKNWDEFVNKNFKSEGTGKTLQEVKLPTAKNKIPTYKDFETSQYSMQQNVENDTKIPSSKKVEDKISMPAVRQNSEVLKVQSERIANQINKTGDINLKERSWVETSTESQVLKDKVLISDLDTGKINYVVQSNKKSLDRANDKLNSLGYEKSVNYVKELINSEKLPNASDIVLAQRVLQESAKKGDIETTQELVMDIAILGTDLGQATQALSIIQRLTPEGQLKLYTKIVQRAKVRGEKSFQSVEITPEMVQNILETYKADGTYDQNDLNARVEKFKQDIADQLTTTTAEKINTWRYLAMLGNPKTHIRNLVSNVAMKYTLKAKNAVARTFETMIPLETKTKTWKKASDVVQKFADKTTIEMKNIITGEAKYSDKGSIEAKKQIFKNKTLEKISDFNSNALSAEDWFFSKSAFKNTFQEYLTANGIITEADIQNNPEIIEKAKQYAVEQAEIATFRQYSKLASLISQAERKNKFARFAIESTVPFKKTPINVAKAGFKYSPLGLIKNVSYDVYQLKSGNINGSQFIDNLSQGLTGTTLTLIGYALAKSGILSGAGGDDKENKYDSNLGKQSYALNIGDSSYSISWLSPVAIPLLVGANAYEKLEEQEDWNPDVIADTLAQTLDPLSEMSFVSSLTDVLTSYSQGSTTMIKDIGETATQSYILQFFPTLFSQFANVLDDKKRSTKVSNNSSFKFGEETVRKIMYKIPGLRNQLEVATDIWGNEKEQSTNIIERAVESFIAPYSKTKDISTTLDTEIKRVYNETGESGVIPNIPYAYVKYKNETYRMSANEYTKYKKTYGQKANAYLTELIKSSSYKLATDEVKAKMMSNVYDFARAEANEEYFKNTDVEYTSDTLKELTKLKEIGVDNKALANYVSDKTQISSIRGDTNYDTTEKKQKVAKIFNSSSLNDKQLSYLYSKYYSTEEKVRAINNVNIPIKEFIKYDLTDFTSDYNARTGQTISGSKQKKVINYINSLKLSVAQKALLIKMEYNSFDGYDNQIINYVRSSSADYLDKAYLLKKSGFDNYDKDIINYVQRHYNTIKEKEEILKKLGFTVRNGRVY